MRKGPFRYHSPGRGVEEARRVLPRLIEEAQSGTPTVITKHGEPAAAIVPLAYLEQVESQRETKDVNTFIRLRGTGQGVYRKASGKRKANTKTLRKVIDALRKEW